MPMISSFLDGHTAGEKVFNGGLVFPLTLSPPANGSHTCDALTELVEQERDKLTEALRLHGAILFRGFDVLSANDFSRVVDALGWEEFSYQGAANRVKVAPRAFRSLNEAPPGMLVNFHHEMALTNETLPKIIFYCLEISPEGGQTCVVPSGVIVERMAEKVPEVVEKLEREGMLSVMHVKDWRRMFKTDDTAEGVKRAREVWACDSVTLNNDGSADIIHGPKNPIRKINGKRVWFNSMLGYLTTDREVEILFGDGSPLPQEAFDTYQKILDENCVDVNWQKGDVLVVDNMTVQHARRPAKPPRVLLVSHTN